MKILMVNKFFYIKGGSETYYFSLKHLLESNGHTVIDFSMHDERNAPSAYSDYFVSHVDYNASIGVGSKMRSAINIIYSLEAKKKFERLVCDTQPDLVHLHIFQHQISPSILDVIKKYRIPAVYTAHDLKMLCLNYKMLQHGKICEACRGGKYYHCVLNKCAKNSTLKSCVNVLEGYFHKWRKSYDVIGKIITPSAFYKGKFEEFGIEPERVVYIPNFVGTQTPHINFKSDREKYYLYFGRLSEEKGVITMLRAFQNLNLPLYIVGTGPLKQEVKDFVEKKSMRHIRLLGFLSGQELKDVVGNAKAVILPSEWYENGPYSAIEALQLGRPIIGANIGGIPELVEGNGYLFSSGDPQSLAVSVRNMEDLTEASYKKMKSLSMNLFMRKYTAEKHYEQLKLVYQEVMER